MNKDALRIFKTVVLMSFSLFLLLVILSGYKEMHNSDYIRWSIDRKLKISDFTMVDYPLKDGAAATTCTGIMMDWEKCTNRYRAFAVFDKNNSKWNIGLVKRQQWVLNHEQLHFDITQFIVNQLNSKLSQDSMSTSKMIREFDKHVIMLDSLQILYDRQTNHGRDSIYQFLWNKIVNNLPK
jgi:hypothetical protein